MRGKQFDRSTIKSEEALFPLIRCGIAEKLTNMGFRVKDVAMVLRVSPAAVTQYLKGRRGNKLQESKNQEHIINALAEKAARHIRNSTGPLEVIELIDAGYQLLAAGTGEKILQTKSEPHKNEWLTLLRERLQLELKAAQKCLALASQTQDDYSKLLLRMIASDSIRHADIVSQIITRLESGRQPEVESPAGEFLNEVLTIEDKAAEVALNETIKIPHRIAQLLLESIDMDEEKHERMIAGMLRFFNEH